MPAELNHVLQKLHNNNFYMFTGEELAILMNFSKDVMTRIKSAADSPFFLGKARPEWISEWMRNHPEFQLSKAPLEPKSPSKRKSSNHRDLMKPRRDKRTGYLE